MDIIMMKEFLNPPNQFRPIPFWSWNDELDPKEIREQIAEMKEAGMGGYFMHARSGLKTPYLSEEWMDCIKAGIDAGKEYDLDAWVYDEEGWPSGFAGGLVPDMSYDYHAKFMTIEEHAAVETIETNSMIACYLYNNITHSYRRMETKNINLGPNEVILGVRRHSNRFYVDTLNKRAIEAFLEVTHEKYYKRFGEAFGKSMHGFFTDEPRLACNHFGELAWSDELPAAFLEQHGYDILDHLPALYRDLPGCEKYRYDFWVTVSNMFATNYMKTIYDWCEAHACKVTGHIMMEESIFSQMTSTAGVMPFYEYMHVPGIDWLRRMISSPVIGKQVGSVACQLGKKQILTESFALCGWNVSFEELKWIAEWQFVNGVNQICQHLQSYTIKGCRKRDYPPSLFTQQTWWKEYKKFNDYLGRLCVALSEGDQTADVLLLHPMRSGYISYDGTRTDAIRSLDEKFEAISYLLSGQHVSYHYGDETIIERYGSVEDGKFVVGRIGYKTVILPEMYAIDAQTMALLLDFIKQGGTVLSLGGLPYYTNGDDKQLQLLNKQIKCISKEELRPYLIAKKLITLSITEDGKEVEDITYLQREAKDSSIYFLVNHSQTKGFKTKITLMGKEGKVLRLKAEDGTSQYLSVVREEGNTVFELTFEPMQSYMLQYVESADTRSNPVIDSSNIEEVHLDLQPDWTIEEMDLNSLTLDYCTYRIDKGEWQARTPVIKLQNTLLELQRPCDVEMGFEFKIDGELSNNREFYVVIEDAEAYTIIINGHELKVKVEGWWKDKKFKKVSIQPYLVPGKNEIILKTEFRQPQKVYDVLFGENVYETEKNKITYDIEIESIYLLGDFGVIGQKPFRRIERNALVTEGDFVIVDAPTKFASHDFTTNGLLFFAGCLKVSQDLFLDKKEGRRIWLDLKKQHAPLVQVFINGQLAKDSLWAPYEIDITDFVQEGKNKVELKFYASNRNLLGPHHHIDGECYNVGPESFTGKWSWVERKSEADATEILDRTKNYWTDTYSFVEFGLFHPKEK